MQDKSFIGVDIGGTSISAGCIFNNVIQKKFNADTGANRAQSEILETLCNVIKNVWVDGVEGIGMGVPGYLDIDEGKITVINNIPAFRNFSIAKAVEAEFNVPVSINNDANCFVLGEAVFGTARKYKNVVGVTLGTGLGGGIVVNNSIVAGCAGGAGEFGCIPYLDKTIEDYCSGKFFKEVHNTTGKELCLKAANGDTEALKIFNEFGTHLGNLFQHIMYFIAPEAIVVGGSVAKSFEYFSPAVFKVLEKMTDSPLKRNIDIIKADLCDAALLGSAALVF